MDAAAARTHDGVRILRSLQYYEYTELPVNPYELSRTRNGFRKIDQIIFTYEIHNVTNYRCISHSICYKLCIPDVDRFFVNTLHGLCQR
jgi:hypothetical protein